MAKQVFSIFYKYKKTNSAVATDAEFLTMAKGTEVIKNTGEEYTKVSSNIFDRFVRALYSRDETNKTFAFVGKENTFTGDNYFSSNVTIGKTLTVDNLSVTTAANIHNLTVPDNLYTKNITNSNRITTTYETITNTLISPLTVPAANNTGSIGTNSLKFANAYINKVYGTSTSALYSDLAEKYTTDKHYDEGTVVEFDESKKAEMTEYKGGALAGVISYKPAVKLNAGMVGGQYVCLKGKVPVKCYSEVKKGQYCIAKEGKVFGISPKDITFEESLRIVGVALEDWDPETETVMVKV